MGVRARAGRRTCWRRSGRSPRSSPPRSSPTATSTPSSSSSGRRAVPRPGAGATSTTAPATSSRRRSRRSGAPASGACSTSPSGSPTTSSGPSARPARHDARRPPEVEMALVELYRETGTRGYLDLARYFVEARGHGLIAGYGSGAGLLRRPGRRCASRRPWRVTPSARSTWRAGAADVGRRDSATRSCWPPSSGSSRTMVATKTYLTGGLGSRWDGEAFGDPYELPPDRAYAETCAAIGGVQWAWRMLLATGEPALRRRRRAHAVQRLPRRGVAATATSSSTSTRCSCARTRTPTRAGARRTAGAAGSTCACCPPNVMRTLASLAGYLATHRRRRRAAPPVRAQHRRRRLSRAARYGLASRPTTRGTAWSGSGSRRRREAAWTLLVARSGMGRRGHPARSTARSRPHRPAPYASRAAVLAAGRHRRAVAADAVRSAGAPTSGSTPSAAASRSNAVRWCTPSSSVDQAAGVVVDDLRRGPGRAGVRRAPPRPAGRRHGGHRSRARRRAPGRGLAVSAGRGRRAPPTAASSSRRTSR